MIKQDFSV